MANSGGLAELRAAPLVLNNQCAALRAVTFDARVCAFQISLCILKRVNKLITKKLIVEKVRLINSFYKKVRKIKPKIGVTGLNPHCETFAGKNIEKTEILPAVKFLKKKKIKISGPFSADTIFLKNNRKKFDVIIGMYHDQVLAPMKTIFGFDAINITIGLPFIRITPDHGPNYKMFGLNKSNPKSLIQAFSFLNKYSIKA